MNTSAQSSIVRLFKPIHAKFEESGIAKVIPNKTECSYEHDEISSTKYDIVFRKKLNAVNEFVSI